MNITVTGSLGNISKPLIQELVRKSHTVTGRNAGKIRLSKVRWVPI